MQLAERAAEVGIERFVLDDGWFQGRRDDTTSLGDWVVDSDVWPDGLVPARRARARPRHAVRPVVRARDGLARLGRRTRAPRVAAARSRSSGPRGRALVAHASTSWILRTRMPTPTSSGRSTPSSREVGVDFIKWDHNRDLVESTHDGRPGGHLQMLAVYRLIAELKERHPALEIESCSSGGARTDLGILEVCDRVWASDSNDPVERQDIQRWTGLLLPPELVGAHVGPTTSHSSGRTTALSYRMATSLHGLGGLRVGHPVVRRGRDRHDPAVRRRSTGSCGRSSTPARSCTPTSGIPRGA